MNICSTPSFLWIILLCIHVSCKLLLRIYDILSGVNIPHLISGSEAKLWLALYSNSAVYTEGNSVIVTKRKCQCTRIIIIIILNLDDPYSMLINVPDPCGCLLSISNTKAVCAQAFFGLFLHSFHGLICEDRALTNVCFVWYRTLHSNKVQHQGC